MQTPGAVRFRSVVLAGLVMVCVLAVVPDSGAATNTADQNLQRALDAIVARDDGPPGISVVVQHGSADPVFLTAGVAGSTSPARFR